MDNRNKLHYLFVVLFTLVGCNNAVSNNSSLKESSKEEPFTNKIEAKLSEGEDYIDHEVYYGTDDFEYDTSMWYINKLDKVPLPDPHVFEEEGVYYIVGTNDAGQCRYVDCYITTDFVEFEFVSKIFDPSKYNGWENKENPTIYAPEIFEVDGYYYMYYSAKENTKKGTRRNSVVRAEDPLGPYEPIIEGDINGLDAPLFNHDEDRGLDATLFIDDDGKMYMYYASNDGEQYIVGVEMKSPYEADWSTRTEIVRPGSVKVTDEEKPLYWETYRTPFIAEAPYMLKSPNGKYYMTYSVNGCWNKYYSVCYAVSDSPLGEYIKPYEEGKIWTNLLMGYSGTDDEESDIFNQWAGFASGTGHHSFFNIGDQIMIGYHAHQNRNYNSQSGFMARYFAMDPLYFDKDGIPFVNGPSYSLQPLPEAISGYKNVALNAKVRVQNVTNESAINDNYIVDNYNLETEDKEVHLGEGYSYIELTFDKEYTVGGIAVYNSAYYEKTTFDIKYIDLMNGNAFEYPQFSYNYYNTETEFTFPNSSFTYEFKKEIKTNKVILCFDLYESTNINEIVVLGK